MKKRPQTPLVLFPSEKGGESESDYRWNDEDSKNPEKKISVLSYIRGAAKKVARVFRVVFSRHKKSTDEGWRTDVEESEFGDRDSCFSNYSQTESSSQASTISKPVDAYRFSSSTNSRRSNSKLISTRSSLGSRNQRRLPVIFSFKEIQKATSNFSAQNIIGEGSFGTVYRGRLRDGSLIAVKRARKNMYDRNTMREFKNEIYTLSKIEHLNLVKLYGFLEHEDERIIVVEHVGNGNLREHLDGLRGNRLEMADRLEIAIDVAHAITYLHTYTDTPVIHRDIKATNILITERLRAKVADFGFARLVTEDPGATHISTQVKGSAGYVDPDYLRTYQLSEKSDVYSFAVLLVELVTGRRPIESKRPRKERLTVKWAMWKLGGGEVVVVMDPVLRRSQVTNMIAEKILRLAKDCLADYRVSRPTMKTCVEVLWGIRKESREQELSSSPSSSTSNYADKDGTGSRYTLPRIEDEDSGELFSHDLSD